MIARLKGTVDQLGDGSVVIDVGGVGYLAFCSSKTLGQLAVGEAVSLEIETHVREDHIHLYGFRDAAERDWFKLLTSVQGVGAKVGLAVLGVLGPDDLMRAVAAGDKAMVTQTPGVGPKLATRILSELKDKVGVIAIGQAGAAKPTAAAAPGARALSDAASALANLGYGPAEALGAVSRVADRLGNGVPVEELIREGLRELAPGDAGRGG